MSKGVHRPPPPGAAWKRYKAVLSGAVASGNGPVGACGAGGGPRWRIDEPHDGKRLLSGVCRKCGAQRADFKAGDDQVGFSDEVPSGKAAHLG